MKKNTKVLSIPPMKKKTREFLLNHIYKEDIQKLEKLIDKDLRFWK